MKIMLGLLLTSQCCLMTLFANQEETFSARVEPVRVLALRQLAKRTMLSDYALESNDLRYVTFDYYDDHGNIRRGTVLLHKDIAGQFIDYYYQLFESRESVTKGNLIETFYKSCAVILE